MMKLIVRLSVVMMLITLQFCSSDSSSHRFSNNEPPVNPSGQFDLLDEFPAIQDAFTNTDDIEQQTINPYDFNQHLADAIAPVIDHLTQILPYIDAMRNPLADMMSISKSMVSTLINQDSLDQDPWNNYAENFYDFLENASAADLELSGEILDVLQKLVGYLKDIHGGEIETVMDDLIVFLQQSEWPSLKAELPLLQEGMGKLLVRTDSTIMDGATNTQLGKAVSGLDIALAGIRDIAQNDPEARESLYNVIRTIGNVLTAKVGTKDFKTILRELMMNVEDYATQGGSVYAANTSYYNDSTGVGTGYYVNTELRNSVKQLLPALKLLFFRAKGSWESRPDYAIVRDTVNGEAPVEMLSKALYDLKKNCNINFSNYQLEPSLKRMVEYNGLGQLRSSVSYKVSYLDHLLFTLKAANDFGFLTRRGSASNEPYQNNEGGNHSYNVPHGHERSTGGILTVNDCLYSMTSNPKHSVAKVLGITVVDLYLGAYTLSLDPSVSDQGGGTGTFTTLSGRKDQRKNVYRSSFSFTSTQANQTDSIYQFPMGYDFPSLTLLSGFSAGDAGIPNGGYRGIIPTSDITAVGDSRNDYRTYFPYVGNGLGELNTGRWTMGWIARVCWEGEGPYYYADSNAPTESISGKAYHKYFRPDGRIYALVHKANPSDPATWEYFYPVDGGNDVKDPSNTQLGTYYLRENRYKAVWETDKIMIKTQYSDNSGETRFYTINRVVGTSSKDKYRLRKINDPDDTSDEVDAGLTSNLNAGGLTVREKIAEKSAIRECASQEEAMYRNFQWLMLEKKIVFIMPMRSYVNVTAAGCVDIYLDPAIITVLEANGILGMNNLKKGSGIGVWNILGSEGIPSNPSTDLDRCITGKDYNGNVVNYGRSDELGDGRIFIIVREDAAYALGSGDYVDVDTIWNTILGSGSVTPAILGDNLAPIARMAFLQSSYVASNATGATWSNAWSIRNKLLPIVVALAGTLHGKSYYEPPASGYWYNFASNNHKYPLKYLGDMISALVGPYARYYKTPYSGSTTGWWVPQIEVPTFTGYSGNFGFFTPKPVSATVDFKPRASLRTVANLMTENTIGSADGLIPALANTTILTDLLAFLQHTGKYGSGVPAIYNDTDKTSSDYVNWSARRKIFYGIEQMMARAKSTQSIEYTRGYGNVTYPAWFFVKGSEDVDVDIALDEIIGADSLEKGIAVFVDYRDSSHTKYKGYNWNNFNKLINGAGELLGQSGTTNGAYCITENLINVIDTSLTGFAIADDHLKSLRHTMGTQMYQYKGGSWVIPAELKNMVTKTLPELLTPYDGRYMELLTVAENLLQDNGWVDYVMTNISSSWGWEAIINDFHGLLSHEALTNPNSKFYDGLCERLTYFHLRMTDGIPDNDIYIRGSLIGMPASRPVDYLYSSEFDPFGALGEILSK